MDQFGADSGVLQRPERGDPIDSRSFHRGGLDLEAGQLFAAEELGERTCTRDPVVAAEPSASAKRKKATRRAADGPPLHSFRTLLEDLASVTRNVCCAKGPSGTRRAEFELDTQLSAEHARALELLKGIRV